MKVNLPARTLAGLPATIGKLHEYVLLSAEKVKAYKLVLKSADRQGAKEIYERTLAEAQIVGESALYAEARMGEMLGEVERRGGSSTRGTSHPLPKDIDKKSSFYAQQLARHPEAIEAAVAEAKERGDIPTRREVLGVIRRRDPEAARTPPIEPARTDQNHAYRELLRSALAGAEGLRVRLSRVVHSRPETRVQDGPIPTDAIARELEGELKAKLSRIAELGARIPGGRMVEAGSEVEGEFIGREISSRRETPEERDARFLAEMPEEKKRAAAALGVTFAVIDHMADEFQSKRSPSRRGGNRKQRW